ncbi:glycosyltransferase family 4 protein [soil metagenome]
MTEFAGLRVVLVGPLAPPAGGMANQTRQLAELLRAAQADVVMARTNAPYLPGWIGRWPGVRALFRLVPYLWTLWCAARRADVFHVMANSGWAWHLFSAPAIWIASLRGVPVVVNYRGGEAARFLARSERLVRWSMRRASVLAVPSRFLEEIFARHGMKSVVVPNIVDLARFHPRDASARTDAHMLVARNLEPIYDNQTALRAFAQVHGSFPQARLTIAGTGPEAARLRALAVELGVQNAVRFAGQLDRDAMAALYRDADLSINPSLADNMPNSLLESMACGVPIVSTNVGGVPFIVEDGQSALLVAPGDAQAMADAVLKLLVDRSLWSRLAAAGVSEAQRYTWVQVAPLLANVYRSAIRPAAR